MSIETSEHGDNVTIFNDESLTVGTTYASALGLIDVDEYRAISISIHNTHATNGIEYQIYGTNNPFPSTDIAAADWMNLVSIVIEDSDGESYDHDEHATVAAGKNIIFTSIIPYTRLDIRVKSTGQSNATANVFCTLQR